MKQRESSEVVKERIIKVATALFARDGVDGVSIRKIAEEAGINHALIIRYFGTKEALVKEILQKKITAITAYPINAGNGPEKGIVKLREILLNTLADQDTMKLIVRSGLDGLSPESYIDESRVRAAALVAKWIGLNQQGNNLPDAKLVSLVVTGALFSLASIAPWLMTSVGLSKDGFEDSKEDILDVIIWMIARAVGLPTEPNENNG